MTDKERTLYVRNNILECTKPVTTIRKGSGCKVGEKYRFEYVHDTGDNNEFPDADLFYRKLSDNNHYDEVFITDEQLINNFNIIKQ